MEKFTIKSPEESEIIEQGIAAIKAPALKNMIKELSEKASALSQKMNEVGISEEGRDKLNDELQAVVKEGVQAADELSRLVSQHYVSIVPKELD